jgi:mRNA interferase RelE/StbE
LKRLSRQHHPILPRLIRAIDDLALHPFAGKPLKGEKRESCSLRVGDFRIIYDLYPDRQTVHLIRVGDRKEIYR